MTNAEAAALREELRDFPDTTLTRLGYTRHDLPPAEGVRPLGVWRHPEGPQVVACEFEVADPRFGRGVVQVARHERGGFGDQVWDALARGAVSARMCLTTPAGAGDTPGTQRDKKP